MTLYGQDRFLKGSAAQIAAWLNSTDSAALEDLASRVSSRVDNDLPIRREDLHSWIRDCTRTTKPEDRFETLPYLPKVPRRDRAGRGSDAYRPPQVGAKDHGTLRDRLQYQQRGLHLPYIRAAAYDQTVVSGQWTRAGIKPHDDPYELSSGNGFVINQDGLWTFIVKTDWSIGHAELVVGAAQATRLMVNGSDVGLRDYLDDDAYSAQMPINTFMWTDEFRAGATINIDVRSEGLGSNYTAKCNVYVRAYLVRCHDGEFDMVGFPLPPDKVPDPQRPPAVPNPPLRGYTPTVPTQPAQPQYTGDCGGVGSSFHPGFTVNSTGQVGYYKCVDGQVSTQWSAYGWDGGQYFGGGGTGATVGGPGPMPWQW